MKHISITHAVLIALAMSMPVSADPPSVRNAPPRAATTAAENLVDALRENRLASQRLLRKAKELESEVAKLTPTTTLPGQGPEEEE